jgi:hypothetical protein
MAPTPFTFIAGGALRTDANCYIERQTDRKAEQSIRQEKFLYVTAPRQMGKTSLLNRLRAQLSANGWQSCSIDMATLKRLEPDVWFSALGTELGRQLRFPPSAYPTLKNQMDFKAFILDSVGLAHRDKRLAIFFDEIEGLLGNPFADGFLMVMRDLYNQREAYPGHFIAAFAGAINPEALIKDPTISPFNVAEQLTLEDFTFGEAHQLTSHLAALPVPLDPAAHRHIYNWTGGQPYLIQRICATLVGEVQDGHIAHLTCDAVDRVVAEQILNPLHRDVNVTHVLNELDKLREPAKTLWQRLLTGAHVSPHQAGVYAIYLAGAVTTTRDDQVVIRNRIYEQAVRATHTSEHTTHNQSPMAIPLELVEQLRKGNIMLFCGAGISISANGLPSSGQLVQELAQRANLGDASKLDLPAVAQAYAGKKGIQNLIAYITDRIDNPRYKPLRTHELIAELPFKYLFTTNWDNLQEKALERAGKAYHKVVKDTDLAFADEEKVMVVKVHGSVEQKESIVVMGDDYYNVIERLPETFNLLRSFLATKTILFIGFGLADNDFKQLYQKVERRLSKLTRRAYAVQLNPTAHAPTYWMLHNVEIISADATAFLEELKRQYLS